MDGQKILKECERIYEDLDFRYIKEWKERTGGRAIGILPIYFPKEILHAAGILPVELYGGGDLIDVVRGDSFYQSYICHIPRSMIDLGLSGRLNELSGLICPFVCDVIRNFSGVWSLLFPDTYVRFFDHPQNFDPEIGGEYLISQFREIIGYLEQNGRKVTNDRLNESIGLYNQNRKLIRKLYEMRAERPWQIPTYEVYLLMRAGGILEVTEFNQWLIRYMDAASKTDRKPMDNVRVIVSGAFCEQPSPKLLRVIELAGCYIVDDDFLLGNRYLDRNVEIGDDPLRALSHAYLASQVPSSCRFEEYAPKSERLVKAVKEWQAEGVIFAAPSFCDPALEDRPCYQQALEAEKIRYMSLQYSEDTKQFNLIREQIGTFADSIKLSEA